MTQHYLGQIPDPSQESGNDLAARLNSFDNGHRTNQSGPTRPAGILPGGVWTRVVGGVYDLMLFDGAQDRVVMRGDQNLSGLTDLERSRQNLGLGKLATKDKAHIVNETEGTLSLVRGGTGAGDAAGARTAFGLAYASKAEAEAGTANNKSMTPLRTLQAIAALTAPGLGEGQTWVDVLGSRSVNTAYQNTTGRPIMVAVGGNPPINQRFYLDASTDGVSWVRLMLSDSGRTDSVQAVVLHGHYYRIQRSSGSSDTLLDSWTELR